MARLFCDARERLIVCSVSGLVCLVCMAMPSNAMRVGMPIV
ncbi:MAG TPA: hypothetical protein VGI10_05585 [Polyangiaceae bacterium]